MHLFFARTLSCALLVLVSFAHAVHANQRMPVISIIIDDLGYSLTQAETALSLPHGVTLSILPFAPYSKEVSERARAQNREYMLHIPMQGHERENLDPGILTSEMDNDEFLSSLSQNLDAISGYAGINNHKGSELTADGEKMRLLLRELATRESLFIIDSKTSAESYISHYAREYGVSFASRNVFLDVDRAPEAIERQFRRLLTIARERGYAIAIGHPYPETLSVLVNVLAGQSREEFLLLPVQQQLALRSRDKGTVADLTRPLSIDY